MYNTEAFKDQPPKSWKVVFEEMTLPDGKSNKGRVRPMTARSMSRTPPTT